MKIWELHGVQLRGEIRSTSEGHADVAGLILSEKAYLLAIRDLRPAALVNLVHTDGPEGAARVLIEHYGQEEALNHSGGRGLVLCRAGAFSGPLVCRADEVRAPQLVARLSV